MSTPKSRKSSTAELPLSDADLLDRLRRALSGGAGLTGPELCKQVPKVDAARALEKARELCARGELFRVKKGATERFFGADPVASLDRLVPPLLDAGALSAAQIKTQLERTARGHGPLLPEWLKGALARGLLFEQARSGGARTKTFGRQPDLRLLLHKALVELRKSMTLLDRLGVARPRVLDFLSAELGASGRAAPPDGTASRRVFLEALRKLAADNPQGALLPVREVRARAGLPKQDFDDTALALSREGLLLLHHHDHPGSLSDAEQGALVRDPHGTHYVGMALRGSA